MPEVPGFNRSRFESELQRPTQLLIAVAPSETTVGTSATTVRTVDVNKFFLIEECTITNVTVGTETFTVYLVESGGAAGTSNAVIYQEQIAINSSLRLSTLSGLMLDPGTTLQIKTSSSAGINITLWGIEVSGV
jgi:hypothetical protein